jgi:hypothetical protein
MTGPYRDGTNRKELDLSTIERVQRILRTVHDQYVRSALPSGLAFQVLRGQRVCSYRRKRRESGKELRAQDESPVVRKNVIR